MHRLQEHRRLDGEKERAAAVDVGLLHFGRGPTLFKNGPVEQRRLTDAPQTDIEQQVRRNVIALVSCLQ